MHDYSTFHKIVFGTYPREKEAWLNFSFDAQSPEGRELVDKIREIEWRYWGKFLATMAEEKIPGDIMEFGIYWGASTTALLNYCEKLHIQKTFWGFDSFEGLPAPGTHDPDCWHEGQYRAEYEQVYEKLNCAGRPWFKLVKGLFADSAKLPEVAAVQSVAFARVDFDLYEPSAECLDFLTGRLSHGAFLLFDDWTDNPDLGETKAFFDWVQKVRHRYYFKHLLRTSDGGMSMRVFHHPT